MDVGAVSGALGKGDCKSNICGKAGHLMAYCWALGGGNAGKGKGAGRPYTHCGKSGHSASGCRASGGTLGGKGGGGQGKAAATDECRYCGKKGHHAKECRTSDDAKTQHHCRPTMDRKPIHTDRKDLE